MGQQETYLVHNSQCVKPHSRDRLLVITEEKKMHWVDASSTFIVNAMRQSFGMVGRLSSLRLILSKKIPALSHYTLLEY